MIPGFQEFLFPVLKFMGDSKEHSRDEISEQVPKLFFSFTDEELNEKTKNGNKFKVFDRIEWSITYLKQAGLLTRTRRSHYKISEQGITLLNSGIKEISSKFLYDHFPSFRDFQNRTRSSKTNTIEISPKTDKINKSTGQTSYIKDYLEYERLIDHLRSYGTEPSKEQLDKLEELRSNAMTASLSSISISYNKSELFAFNEMINVLFSITPDGYTARLISNATASHLEGNIIPLGRQLQDNIDNKRRRRPNWNFYNLGLIDGDIIQYIPDPTQKAMIASKKGVEYEGELFESLDSLSRFLGDSDKRLDPTSLWSFEGESLADIYNYTFPKEE